MAIREQMRSRTKACVKIVLAKATSEASLSNEEE